MSRLNFSINITGRRDSPVINNAMHQLGSFLPPAFVIVAAGPAQAHDFLQVIDRSRFDGRYIASADVLKGLRDITVVRLGNYQDHSDWEQIDNVLRTSTGRVTYVDVSDWR